MTKRAALLALAKGLAFALAFPLPLILVRTLSQTEFGVYKQFSQVMLTALGLLSLHVGSEIKRSEISTFWTSDF